MQTSMYYSSQKMHFRTGNRFDLTEFCWSHCHSCCFTSSSQQKAHQHSFYFPLNLPSWILVLMNLIQNYRSTVFQVTRSNNTAGPIMEQRWTSLFPLWGRSAIAKVGAAPLAFFGCSRIHRENKHVLGLTRLSTRWCVSLANGLRISAKNVFIQVSPSQLFCNLSSKSDKILKSDLNMHTHVAISVNLRFARL